MIRRLALAGTAVMLAAAAPAPRAARTAHPAAAQAVVNVPTGPVALAPRPGTVLDATARRVASADIADGDSKMLLLLGSQRLGTAGIGPALFVQVQSDRSCGSAGCATSVYLPTAKGWVKVLDGVSGAVVVDARQHGGMQDLVTGESDRWQWNGHTYADTLPAPQVDLRPRKRPTRTPSRAHP